LSRNSLIVSAVAMIAGTIGLGTLSFGAAEPSGTLNIEFIGTPKHVEGRPVWIYLSNEGQRHDKGVKTLFAKGTIEAGARFEGKVPAGRYYFILVSAEPVVEGSMQIIGGLRANRSCYEVAEVKPGAATRKSLDISKGTYWSGVEEGCYIPTGMWFNLGAEALSGSAAAELLVFERKVESSKRWCAKQAAPLVNLLAGEPLKSPFVVLPDADLTGRRESNIHDLELDAEELRHFIRYLSLRCWTVGFPWHAFELTRNERLYAEVLTETVKNERAKIEGLDEIADTLEAIQRSPKK